MKQTKTALALALAAVALVGCDESPTEQEQSIFLDQRASQQVTPQLAQEEVELKQIIAKLQEKDPNVVDAYYGYENGERVLHIVRQDPTQGQNAQASNGLSESVWPLVAGVGAGMLLANAMNSSGGYHSYSRSHQPKSYSYYDEKERRKRRNVVTSGYASTLMSNSRNQIRSNPSYKTDLQKSVQASRISSRSTGVFSSSSSARSASYSSGG
jgi:hypothetical protein